MERWTDALHARQFLARQAPKFFHRIYPPDRCMKLKYFPQETSKALQAVNLQGLVWCARKDSNLHGGTPTRT